MDIKTTIKELSDRLGPPKQRAAFGQWIPAAWLVRGLVDRGHGVTDAVNHVLAESGLSHNKQSFGSLRAAYYKVKGKEWPAQLDNPEPEGGEEGFE